MKQRRKGRVGGCCVACFGHQPGRAVGLASARGAVAGGLSARMGCERGPPLLAPARIQCFPFSLCVVCMWCLRRCWKCSWFPVDGWAFPPRKRGDSENSHSMQRIPTFWDYSHSMQRIPTFQEYSHFSFPLFFESGNGGGIGGNGECRMVIGFVAMN